MNIDNTDNATTEDYNDLFDASLYLDKQENDNSNLSDDPFGKDEISFSENNFSFEEDDDEIPNPESNNDLEFEDEKNEENLFEENEEKPSSDNSDFDIEAFNKKFGKNFKTEEEVKNFFEGKNPEEEKKKTFDDELAEVSNIVSILNDTINLKDEDLMREKLKNEARKLGKDVTNEDVLIEIEDELDEMSNRGVLDIKAEQIRFQIQQVLSIKNSEKQKLVDQKTQIETQKENAEKQNLQGALVEFLNNDNFYGIKLSKEVISEVYKEIRSNKFLDAIKSNPKEQAELALMKRFKEQIFKKASGKTYADGMKAILDEFKLREKDNPVLRAQRKGSAGASDNSKDLIESILFEKSKEKVD